MSDLLWAAVDRLTQPNRERVRRDDGTHTWVTMPSLFDQLAEAVQNGAGSTGRGSQASRPPLDVACVSLLCEIAGAVREARRSYRLERVADTPDELRRLASHLVRLADADLTECWTDQINGWCRSIRVTISNDPDRSWRLHGLACPTCGGKSVPERQQSGEVIRTPAIQVIWSDGLVRAVECRLCSWVAYRGAEMEQIADARETA